VGKAHMTVLEQKPDSLATTTHRSPAVRARVLQVHRLTRTFGALRAVDGISFEVCEGEILSIIGPNGSGKTTTINLLSGLIPQEGLTIALNGTRIDRLSAPTDATGSAARRTRCARSHCMWCLARSCRCWVATLPESRRR
jgi:branched-chain amino acid transport system ATP-binding protein